MSDNTALPFELRDVFFVNIHTQRAGKVTDPITLNIAIGVRFDVAHLPKLEVGMHIATPPEEKTVVIQLDLVSIYEALDGATNMDESVVVDFINQKALPMLWPYGDLLVRQLSASMGIPAIKVHLPFVFDIPREAIFPRE
jgi:hypothetical protein